MRAVLSQVENGKEKLIACAPKKFAQSQRQYCIATQELLALLLLILSINYWEENGLFGQIKLEEPYHQQYW